MAKHFMSTKVGGVRTSGGGWEMWGGGSDNGNSKDFTTCYFYVYPRTHANTLGDERSRDALCCHFL